MHYRLSDLFELISPVKTCISFAFIFPLDFELYRRIQFNLVSDHWIGVRCFKIYLEFDITEIWIFAFRLNLHFIVFQISVVSLTVLVLIDEKALILVLILGLIWVHSLRLTWILNLIIILV